MASSAVYGISGRRPLSLKRRLGIALRFCLLLLPVVLLLGGLVWFTSYLLGLTQQWITLLPPKRPQEVVLDPAHLLPEAEKQGLTHQVLSLNHAMQADWMVVIVPQLDPRQTQAVGEKLFARWQVGHHSLDHRGALLLVTARPQKASLILGKELQHSLGKGLFPLAGGHVGEVLQDHMLRLSLENKPLSQGLLTALNVINQHFNPRFQLVTSGNSSSAGFFGLSRRSSLVLPPAE